MGKAVVLAVVLVASLIIYFNFTIFIVQPIGAAPEGRTLVISRQGKLEFVDSADAICVRTHGGGSLLCRGVVLGAVAKETTIFARLPYSEMLYLYSTGGKTYDR